jgi:hypothetical protein
MTGMEAVEIAQGDDGAAQGFGDGQVGGQAIMESALSVTLQRDESEAGAAVFRGVGFT